MFDAFQSNKELIHAIALLDPFKLSPYATSEQLNGRADYIKALGKLVADHIEAMAADADASISSGHVDDDAGAIRDVCSDICGEIRNAAERVLEAA
jgi:hypothetical protein